MPGLCANNIFLQTQRLSVCVCVQFIRIGVGVNRTTNKGTTALHECAATKDGERGVKVAEDKRFFLCAALLLEAGANPWQENAKGERSAGWPLISSYELVTEYAAFRWIAIT